MKQKRVYLFWYNWQNGFWNTPEHGQNRENYMYTPVEDLNFFQTADSYYGDGRVWGVGSQVDEEKKLRIMELLDWLASPEGLTYQHNSLEGFIYTVNDDGTYTLTKEGQDRLPEISRFRKKWAAALGATATIRSTSGSQEALKRTL